MFRLDSEETLIEIIVREASGAKIESYKFKIKDKKQTRTIMNLLKHKYGFDVFPKKDKDISWLNKQDWN